MKPEQWLAGVGVSLKMPFWPELAQCSQSQCATKTQHPHQQVPGHCVCDTVKQSTPLHRLQSV